MTRARIGVVLAGGLASRMDGDKAGARLGGRSLLEGALSLVDAAGLSARVCARATTTLPPVPSLQPGAIWREPASDAAPGASAHPLAGIAHAAREAREPIVALPVDLPLLPPTALAALAAQPLPLAVVGVDGRPAALVVRVDPSFAPALAEAAAAGAPALRTLVALGAAVLDLTDLAPGIDVHRALTNVNDAGDLRAARLLIDQPRPRGATPSDR